MKIKAFLAIVLLTLPMSISAQRKTSFETGWKFHRNGVINAEMPDCDDSSWRTVTLPHGDAAARFQHRTVDDHQRLPSYS